MTQKKNTGTWNGLALSLAAATVALIPVAASAHHSFAMFDDTKERKVSGTVVKYRFANPHIYVVLTVKEAGKDVSYLLEGPTPAILNRLGWKPTTLKTGDKVVVKFHPLKDGKPGGNLLGVVLPTGKAMTTENEAIKY